MIVRLALRGLLDRPWRSMLLLGGFGLGVGVMITLLAIGEAMVLQSRDEKLVGGGDVTVLPEGMDLEVMKTGGVGGMFVAIPNARFVHRQLLASPRLAGRVAAVAPQTDGVLLYVRTGGAEYPVRAMGEIPSATRAVGAAATIVAGAWDDDAGDRRWIAPTPAELRHEIDHFHHTPPGIAADERATWGEWHYFNVLSADRKRWAFLTLAVGGDVPGGPWGAQVLLTVHEEGRPARRFMRTVAARDVAFDTTRADLALGTDSVRVLPDGRYRVTAAAREVTAGRDGARAALALTVTPAPGAYFPGTSIGGDALVSGYAVPALRAEAEGSLCIDGRCERFTAAQAYHDHNWGVWRDVEWEWGAARVGTHALLFGRVARERADDVREPLFVYLVDSLGFRALFRPESIAWVDGRTARVGGREIRVPSRAVMVDARDGDTLRIELAVEDAAASDVRIERRGLPRAPRARPYFIQMKGLVRIRGRIGGRALEGEGTGFFETYR